MNSTKKPANDSFSQAILDSLNVIMAVLEPDGRIFAVNEAWKRMARESCPPDRLERTGIGTNYLQVCKEAQGTSATLAPEALAGIEAVLRGAQSSFTLEYPCFSPTRKSWYLMDVTSLPQHEGAVVAHIDITERKQLEQHLQSEIEMAAKIQSQLLPQKLPQVRGLNIFAYSYQAEQVGGDFYDFFSYASHPFAFLIADISGKGLSAAFLVAMTYTTLHTVIHALPITDPQALLFEMNENLYDDFSVVGMFATVFTGCYDPITRHLLYANAGHSPVIYCPKGGPAVLLEADAPGLGIVSPCACQNHQLWLRPHDVVIAGTDGLNECFNAAGEMFGYERLLNSIETLAHLPSHQIGNELLKTINQFAQGEKQSDDQTLIVLKA